MAQEFVSVKELTKKQLGAIKQDSKGYRKQGIQFVSAKGDEENVKSGRNGEFVSTFYKSVVATEQTNTSKESNLCDVCGLKILDKERHHLSSAHLANTSFSESPLSKLPVSKDGLGYKYLRKYGWSEFSKHGLGALGREGRRHPVKASLKNNRHGIGSEKPIRVLKEQASKLEKPQVRLRDIHKQAEKERRRHHRIMTELSR